MSSFILKLIAAASMLLDHMGILFFPGRDIFRILGRLAFALFAFCIAEGFRYTRSRWKYFLRIFVLGFLCQVVYTIAERDFYLGILITFSLSIALMAALDCVKTALRGEKSALAKGLGKLLGGEIGEAADRAVTTAVFLAGCFGVFRSVIVINQIRPGASVRDQHLSKHIFLIRGERRHVQAVKGNL